MATSTERANRISVRREDGKLWCTVDAQQAARLLALDDRDCRVEAVRAASGKLCGIRLHGDPASLGNALHRSKAASLSFYAGPAGKPNGRPGGEHGAGAQMPWGRGVDAKKVIVDGRERCVLKAWSADRTDWKRTEDLVIDEIVAEAEKHT